jgi:gas vesicle protein
MAIRKNDVLEALGLQEDTFTTWLMPSLIGFGVGALVGAAVALLVAPKAGYELREDILDKGRKFVQKGKEQIGSMGSNLSGERPTM